MKTIQIGNTCIGEGAVKICAPLIAGTKLELLTEALEVASMKPDLIEWRVDFYEDAQSIPDLLETLSALRKIIGDMPLIFTCRAAAEGGCRVIPDEARFRVMKSAMEAKLIDLLDIELITEEKDLKPLLACAGENGVYTIVSSHDFEKTPPVQAMVEQMLRIQETGADIAKLAVMPASPTDTLDLLYATYTFKEKHAKIPLIAISMSQIGLISRVAGGMFGSCISFAAGRNASAPGQIEAARLRDVTEVFRVRR